MGTTIMGTTITGMTIDGQQVASLTPPCRAGNRATPFDRSDDMLRNDPRRVTMQLDGAQICAEYSELTGQLCLRQDGTLLREWFPPHSWMAIASVAGASHWGTRPTDGELLALLHNEMALLRTS
jgi:hypothetical protein